MAKWYLEDTVKKGLGEVFILKNESLKDSDYREIYNTENVTFDLIYNPQEKMIGYLLKYRYNMIYPKYCLFNSFGIVYNEEVKVEPEQLNFEVVFEDQVVRLLAYEHNNDIRDFMLVGRWRSTSTDKITDDRGSNA